MIGDTMLFIFAAMFPDFIPAIGFSVFIRHCETFWRVLYWAGGTTQEALVGPLSQVLFVGFPAAFEAGVSLPVQSQPLPNRPQSAAFQHVHTQTRLPPSTAIPLRTSRNKTSAELLDVCLESTHLGVIGATGAGKSTFMRALIASLVATNAQVVVLDPHAGPTTWPHASQVAGAGAEYEEIQSVLDNALQEMYARYKAIKRGEAQESEFPRLVLVCDEWRAIAVNCPNAGNVLAKLLAEGRKACITMIVGTQSKNVKALFGDGEGDGSIRDCLTLLNLTRDKTTRERYGMIDGERYDIPVPQPVPPAPAVQAAFTQDSDDVPHTSTPTNEQIRAWVESGWSRNQICERLTGTKSVRLARINQALEEAQ